jgi:hypothetical protein
MARQLDLTGQRFGRLTAIKKAFSDRGAWWDCQCDCGSLKAYKVSALRAGKTNSCGCSRLNDLTNQKFGRLTVVSRAPNDKSTNTMWNCACECGNTSIVQAGALKAGKVISCGCYNSEKNRTHGVSKNPLFATWAKMISRCYNKNDPAYKNYGARGISVCDAWKNNPAQFVEDMAPKPHGLELDRIDNNGNYSKENCRWTTRQQQCINRRSTRLIEYNGQANSILEWSRITGINRRTITQRLSNGWPVHEALTKPPAR